MESLKNLLTGQEAFLGPHFENLGRRKGNYLCFKNNEWSIVRLNSLQCFLRNFFGFYQSTHLKTVVRAIRGVQSTLDYSFLVRMQAVWNKNYPESPQIIHLPTQSPPIEKRPVEEQSEELNHLSTEKAKTIKQSKSYPESPQIIHFPTQSPSIEKRPVEEQPEKSDSLASTVFKVALASAALALSVYAVYQGLSYFASTQTIPIPSERNSEIPKTFVGPCSEISKLDGYNRSSILHSIRNEMHKDELSLAVMKKCSEQLKIYGWLGGRNFNGISCKSNISPDDTSFERAYHLPFDNEHPLCLRRDWVTQDSVDVKLEEGRLEFSHMNDYGIVPSCGARSTVMVCFSDNKKVECSGTAYSNDRQEKTLYKIKELFDPDQKTSQITESVSQRLGEGLPLKRESKTYTISRDEKPLFLNQIIDPHEFYKTEMDKTCFPLPIKFPV